MEPHQDQSIHELQPTEIVKLLISRRPIKRLWPSFHDKVMAHRLLLRDIVTGEVYVALLAGLPRSVRELETTSSAAVPVRRAR